MPINERSEFTGTYGELVEPFMGRKRRNMSAQETFHGDRFASDFELDLGAQAEIARRKFESTRNPADRTEYNRLQGLSRYLFSCDATGVEEAPSEVPNQEANYERNE